MNERPEIVIPENRKYKRIIPYQFSLDNNTTVNSSIHGPGFRPNFNGMRRYNLLQRLKRETENMIARGGTAGTLDGWEPLPKIPGHGRGLLVVKTMDGSIGHSLEVIIYMEENGNLYFTSDGGNFEVKKNGINDVFTFYVKGQQGGFYPSVYGGITGAKMLTPLIARQMLRMYEQGYKPLATGETRKTRGHRKHKTKKLSRKKTRLNA